MNYKTSFTKRGLEDNREIRMGLDGTTRTGMSHVIVSTLTSFGILCKTPVLGPFVIILSNSVLF